MIRKTSKVFIRFQLDRVPADVVGFGYQPASSRHTEKVLRETWWLLGAIPLYSRDTILEHNL